MIRGTELSWLKNYVNAKSTQSKVIQNLIIFLKNFHSKYIQNLSKINQEEEIITQRSTYFEFLFLKLNTVPKDVAEITFNLFHVCFTLEDQLKRSFTVLSESSEINRHDFNLETFCNNSYEYLFFTCLFVVSKLCNKSQLHIKVKEMIIERNINYSIILLCEVLLLNYIDWKLFLFSPTEMILSILNFLEVPERVLPYLTTNIENYVNYILCEYSIYLSYDLTVISLSICKLALESICRNSKTNISQSGYPSTSNPFISKLEKIIKFDAELYEEVSNCVELINKCLAESEEDCEESQANPESSSSVVFTS